MSSGLRDGALTAGCFSWETDKATFGGVDTTLVGWTQFNHVGATPGRKECDDLITKTLLYKDQSLSEQRPEMTDPYSLPKGEVLIPLSSLD